MEKGEDWGWILDTGHVSNLITYLPLHDPPRCFCMRFTLAQYCVSIQGANIICAFSCRQSCETTRVISFYIDGLLGPESVEVGDMQAVHMCSTFVIVSVSTLNMTVITESHKTESSSQMDLGQASC